MVLMKASGSYATVQLHNSFSFASLWKLFASAIAMGVLLCLWVLHNCERKCVVQSVASGTHLDALPNLTNDGYPSLACSLQSWLRCSEEIQLSCRSSSCRSGWRIPTAEFLLSASSFMLSCLRSARCIPF